MCVPQRRCIVHGDPCVCAGMELLRVTFTGGFVSPRGCHSIRERAPQAPSTIWPRTRWLEVATAASTLHATPSSKDCYPCVPVWGWVCAACGCSCFNFAGRLGLGMMCLLVVDYQASLLLYSACVITCTGTRKPVFTTTQLVRAIEHGELPAPSAARLSAFAGLRQSTIRSKKSAFTPASTPQHTPRATTRTAAIDDDGVAAWGDGGAIKTLWSAPQRARPRKLQHRRVVLAKTPSPRATSHAAPPKPTAPTTPSKSRPTPRSRRLRKVNHAPTTASGTSSSNRREPSASEPRSATPPTSSANVGVSQKASTPRVRRGKRRKRKVKSKVKSPAMSVDKSFSTGVSTAALAVDVPESESANASPATNGKAEAVLRVPEVVPATDNDRGNTTNVPTAAEDDESAAVTSQASDGDSVIPVIAPSLLSSAPPRATPVQAALQDADHDTSAVVEGTGSGGNAIDGGVQSPTRDNDAEQGHTESRFEGELMGV